jgi:hypothetical protein
VPRRHRRALFFELAPPLRLLLLEDLAPVGFALRLLELLDGPAVGCARSCNDSPGFGFRLARRATEKRPVLVKDAAAP